MEFMGYYKALGVEIEDGHTRGDKEGVSQARVQVPPRRQQGNRCVCKDGGGERGQRGALDQSAFNERTTSGFLAHFVGRPDTLAC